LQTAVEADLLNSFFAGLKHARSSVLMLDYDGTLAPFQVDRERARPYEGLVPVLEQIRDAGRTRLVVVSGRQADAITRLLAPLTSFEVWGSHGLEHILPNGERREIALSKESAARLAEARRWLEKEGLERHAELKPGGIALHWRGCSPAEVAGMQASAQRGWAPLAADGGLKLLDFDGGVELRVTRPHKGDAVEEVLADCEAGTPIAYLGDDLTDEDAFRALGGRGLSVLVRSEYRPTEASAWLKPPREVEGFLRRWLGAR
jgi:trehalose 6-phosphate phosphatase